MVRWLVSQGLDAQSFETEFGGEEGDGDAGPGGGAEPGRTQAAAPDPAPDEAAP